MQFEFHVRPICGVTPHAKIGFSIYITKILLDSLKELSHTMYKKILRFPCPAEQRAET